MCSCYRRDSLKLHLSNLTDICWIVLFSKGQLDCALEIDATIHSLVFTFISHVEKTECATSTVEGLRASLLAYDRKEHSCSMVMPEDELPDLVETTRTSCRLTCPPTPSDQIRCLSKGCTKRKWLARELKAMSGKPGFGEVIPGSTCWWRA